MRMSLSVAVALAIGASTAVYADGYGPGPSYAPCCGPTWTGFFVGANIGGSWMSNNASYSQLGGNGAFTTRLEDDGVIGGGQIGYNWQKGAFVLGVEADLAARHLSGRTTAFPFAGDPVDAVTLSQREDWVGTVRGRLGYAAGNWLLYGTGGFAYGDVEHGVFENRITVPGQNRLISDSDTATGWTAGGGIEWAVTPRWSVGVEYLHIDLGTTTLSQGTSVAGGLLFPASAAHFEDRSDVVRATLNYRLGTNYVPLK
jgi:outer membrane immunogenic protein